MNFKIFENYTRKDRKINKLKIERWKELDDDDDDRRIQDEWWSWNNIVRI